MSIRGRGVERVPAPDFGQNCGLDTRPALCRVLPDTQVGYPAPDTTGTRPDPNFFCYEIIFIIICIILKLVDRHP